MPAARVAVLVAGAAIVAAVVVAMLGGTPRELSGNGIRPSEFVGRLPAGSRLCTATGPRQPGLTNLQVTIASGENRRARLGVEEPGRPSSRTPAFDVDADGVTLLPLPRGRARIDAACLVNLGRNRILVAGERGKGARLDFRVQPYQIAIGQIDVSPPRRISVAARVIGDVGSARGGLGGPAVGWVVVALLAGTIGTALAGAWRVLR